MASFNSATSAKLDLTYHYFHIHRYVKSSLRNAEKKIKAHYIEKHNAFYQWEIGGLHEKELIDELNFYLKEKKNSERIIKSLESLNKFSQLVDSYKNIAGTKDINSISQGEWFKIRRNYEEALKKEFETTINNISYKENVRGNTGEENEDARGSVEETSREKEDSANAGDNEGNHPTVFKGSNLEDEAKEKESKTIESEILDILDDKVYLGNWNVRFLPRVKNRYNYHLAVFNQIVNNEVLGLAVPLLKAQYPDGEFELRISNDKGLIEGFLNSRV